MHMCEMVLVRLTRDLSGSNGGSRARLAGRTVIRVRLLRGLEDGQVSLPSALPSHPEVLGNGGPSQMSVAGLGHSAHHGSGNPRRQLAKRCKSLEDVVRGVHHRDQLLQVRVGEVVQRLHTRHGADRLTPANGAPAQGRVAVATGCKLSTTDLARQLNFR